MILFENFKPELENNNDIKKHLEQFPYLRYSIKEVDGSIFLTFGADTSLKYVTGIIAPYTIELVEKEPLKVKVTGKKRIADFEEFKGKLIIGNIEKIDIPSLRLNGILCKVDSGASVSSIDVSFIKISADKKIVTFTPLRPKHTGYVDKKYTAPISEIVDVMSSNGSSEKRVLIKASIVIKGKKLESFFSLADRKELEYPILLGKDIISGNFLIDVSDISVD
jgi:hypothetical protein